MFPNSISFYEAHGKHRNPEEISAMEIQNQKLAVRTYLYGNPLNNEHSENTQVQKGQKEMVEKARVKKAPLLGRLLSIFS
jgi:hypothetical protein